MNLYKYFPKDRVDFIPNRLVRLTPPAAFNDPFDMLPLAKFIVPEEKADNSKIPKNMKEPRLRFAKIALEAQKKFANYGESLINNTGWLQHYASRRYGILCFSERFDSLLMWAHYASDHKGFVVEFDTSHPWLKNGRATAKADDFDIQGVRKVIYSDERPKATALLEPGNIKPSMLPSFMESYFTKGSDWAYEYEWRLIKRLDRATKRISLSPNDIKPPSREEMLLFGNDGYSINDIMLFEVPYKAITAIIFGARMSETDKKILMQCREIPKFNHVRLLQARLSRSRFELEFHPLQEAQERSSGVRVRKNRKTRSQ